jgi:hypothetical protein
MASIQSVPLTRAVWSAHVQSLAISERRVVSHVQAVIKSVVCCGCVLDMGQHPTSGGDWFLIDFPSFGRRWVNGQRVRLCEGLDGRCCCSDSECGCA